MTNFHHTEKKQWFLSPKENEHTWPQSKGICISRIKDDKMSNLVTKPLCPYVSGL